MSTETQGTTEDTSLPSWSAGEPPKDGKLYIAIGAVTYSNGNAGYSRPFLKYVRHKPGVIWVDEDGMSIAEFFEEVVRIFNWSPIPD